jgi:ubiquinone/menaquinone biosynthesis C-methylase UbiE
VGINKKQTHGLKKADLKIYAKTLGLNIKIYPDIVIADATKLPFKENSFDIIISQVALVHVKDKLKAIEEISRVLTVNGQAYLDLDSWQMKKNKKKGIIPKTYKQVYNSLKITTTPRIILLQDNKYISLKDVLKKVHSSYSFKFISKHSLNKKYYEPSFNQILFIHKKAEGIITFPFKRIPIKSNQMTNLSITDHNPASYGIVDVYNKKILQNKVL